MKTFQDTALWCASKAVPDEIVYRSVEIVFSPEGIEYLGGAKPTARSMRIPDGLESVLIPVHPGAARFWKEHGLDVPGFL